MRSKPRSPEPLPAPVGSVIAGRYRVESVLGSGGMGVVIKAARLDDGAPVAIKLIRLARLAHRDAAKRLLREAGAAAKLESPHAVKVFEVTTLDDGTPCVVMEYLEGETLAEHLREHGPLSFSLACRWMVQICDAMSEAHRLGIVHRDLKPQNLFACRLPDETPRAVVLDFGLAKSLAPQPGQDGTTSQSVVLGSPSYMSPEQIRWQSRLDQRTDIWSLGVVLHELLTGGLPFEGAWSAEIFASVLGDLPKPLRAGRPDVPDELEAAVARCLRKDPNERFTSVEELAEAIRSAVPAPADGGEPATRRPLNTRGEATTLVERQQR